MSRYIDVEPLEKALKMNVNGFKHEGSDYARGYDSALTTMKDMLQGFPTADVVEVVRCKDCKFYKDWGDCITCLYWTEDWDVSTEPNAFCSYGERRTD